MERRKDTATILLCRCGWMAVGASFGEVSDEYELHTAGREGHKDERYIPVSNPVIPEAIAMFKKQATVRGDESRALDYLERWREVSVVMATAAGIDPALAVGFSGRIDTEMGQLSEPFKRFALGCAIVGSLMFGAAIWVVWH